MTRVAKHCVSDGSAQHEAAVPEGIRGHITDAR